MRILITGGAGFIGSHLADRLIADGHTVEALDDLSTGRRENLAALIGHPRFRLTEGSVCDEATVADCLGRARRVFHLAAAVGVQRILDRPVETLRTNVLGSETVLRHAAAQGAAVLIASSSETYGKNNDVPFKESDDCLLGPPDSPRWNYAVSKAVAESLAMAYHRRDRLPVVVARLFNTIGPRQRGEYGMVVPRFCSAALAGRPLRIFGDGTQTRCFCHVADTVEALVRLLDAAAGDAALLAGRVFNVGSKEEVSIEQLADLVLELTDSRSVKQFIPLRQAYGRPIEDMARRLPDLTAIEQALAWRPTRPLRQTLQSILPASP